MTSTRSRSERLRDIARSYHCKPEETPEWEAANDLDSKDAEITRLRAALAQSQSPCVYCSLPAEDWAQCQHGFPGCSRADDTMGCPHLETARQQSLDLDAQSALLAQAAAALDDFARIADGSRTVNSLPHLAKIAREVRAAIRGISRQDGVSTPDAADEAHT